MDSMNMPPQGPPQTADEITSAVYSECLYTMVNSAAMLLGKVSAPATGEPVQDLPRVKLIIAQLELAEQNAAKLSLNEQELLKQSLQQLRMAYVSASGKRPEDADEEESSDTSESTEESPIEETAPETAPASESAPSPESAAAPDTADEEEDDDEEESGRKRFVKKYD